MHGTCIKIIDATCNIPQLIYLGNKINNIPTVSRPCHVHISHVHFISHDHSHQTIPRAILQYGTEPGALWCVVVRAKSGKYLT